MSAMRLALQEGQTPRPQQENLAVLRDDGTPYLQGRGGDQPIRTIRDPVQPLGANDDVRRNTGDQCKEIEE